MPLPHQAPPGELWKVTTAELLALQSVASFSVTSHGASPSASASTNVAAIQAALNAANTAGGGDVVFDVAGVYQVNATLTVGSNTRMVGYGSTLRKTGGAYGEVILNKGAATRSVNTSIHISGLTIDCNGNELASANVPGMRGLIGMSFVSRLVIEDCIFLVGTVLYSIHIQAWDNVTVNRCTFSGGKDGVHLGPGHHAVISNCSFTVHDDAIALLAREWATTATVIYDITDVVISNCTDNYRAGQTGFFCRMISGAWASWTTGRAYRQGYTVVATNGKIYRAINGTAASPITSSVEPSHASGDATGADGIQWRYFGDGTYTACHVRRVRLQDNNYLADRIAAISPKWDGAAEDGDRSVDYGDWNAAEVSDIIIDGGRLETHAGTGVLIYATATITDLAIRNLDYRDTGNPIMMTVPPGYTTSTDPRTAHMARLMFENVTFNDPNVAEIAANRQTLTIHINERGSRFRSATGRIGLVGTGAFASTGMASLPLESIPALFGGVGGAIVRTLTADYRYDYGFWLPLTTDETKRLILFAKTTTGATGTAAAAGVTDSGIYANAGTTSTGSGWVRLLNGWSNDHPLDGSGAPNMGVKWLVKMRFQARVNTGALRWYCNGPPTPTAANADALVHKGMGWEMKMDGSNQKIRIIYHDGTTYKQSGWHDLGHVPAIGKYFDVVMSWDGAGTTRLWAVSNSGNSSSSVQTALSSTPSLTITDGPTGTGSAGQSYCNFAAVADGTNAPTAMQLFGVLRTPPVVHFP